MLNKIKRRLLPAVVIFCLLSVPYAANAGSLEDGREAYNSKDYATALKLLEPLAHDGNPDAQYMLGTMYFQGEGVASNKQTAIKWHALAAEKRNLRSQQSLAAIYMNEGPEKDLVKSYMWTLIMTEDGAAAKEASVVALGNLIKAAIEPKMTPAQKDEAIKLAADWQAARKLER